MTLRELLDITSLSTWVTIKNNLRVIFDRQLLSEADPDLFKPYLNEKIECLTTGEQPYVIEITLRTMTPKEIEQEAHKDFTDMLKYYTHKFNF